MQILYRYIFRRSVAATLFVVMTCCVIASLINLFDILDDVVKQNVSVGNLFEYLVLGCVPRMIELLMVMLVLAGLFTMGEFSRRLELTAMRSAGCHDRKLLYPVLWLATLILAFVFHSQLDWLPELHRQADVLKSVIKSGRQVDPMSEPFYVRLTQAALQSGGGLPGTPRNQIESVKILVFSGSNVSELYQAGRMVKRGTRWFLESGFYRRIDPPTGQVLKYQPFDSLDYPPTLPPPEKFLFEVAHRKNQVQWMSARELISARSFLARQEIHSRIATAFAPAIGVLLGAWFGMRMLRFNVARAICLAILIGFVHRLVFDAAVAVGVETGASWACHMANILLISSASFARSLTSA